MNVRGLLHGTHGKCWSVRELETMLRDVGFAEVAWRPTTGDRSVVLAHKAT